jgi:hypothetical protein
MSKRQNDATQRREFIKDTTRIAVSSVLAGVALPQVHAGEDNTIRLALIGCGGRGNGAAANAMSAGGLVLGDDSGTKRAQGSAAGGPIKLVALADLRQDRLDQSHNVLSKMLGDMIDVPRDRQFLGFQAYRQAIDCLRPGDVAILATHAAFRGPVSARPKRASLAAQPGASLPVHVVFRRGFHRIDDPFGFNLKT